MTGDSKDDARASVNAIFEALPKKRQMEYLGELNEALLYIESHTRKDGEK